MLVRGYGSSAQRGQLSELRPNPVGFVLCISLEMVQGTLGWGQVEVRLQV